jgi:outer membrane lipopolysaccharide assembly protein LptE/RlpB
MLRRATALSMILSLVVGCGWQVRGQSIGSGDISTKIYVQAAVDQPVAIHLRNALTLRNNLAERSNADVIVEIGPFEKDRRIAAVDQIGEANVYRITIANQVRILDSNGVVISDSSRLSLSDNYNYDRRILDAMEQEERDLITRLERQLADAILRRAIISSRTQ